MKYTAKELYEYCENNGLIFALFVAMNNNDIGFEETPVEATISMEDGKITLHVILEENITEPIDFDLSNETNADELSALYECAKNGYLKCSLCKIGELDYSAVFVCDEDEKVAEEKLWKELFICFLDFAGIDTIGRLKALLRKGEENYQKWQAREEFLKMHGVYEDMDLHVVEKALDRLQYISFSQTKNS